jgi:hypothetical protein
MSHGIKRNEAQTIAKRYISQHLSYEQAYRNFLLKQSVINSFRRLGESFQVASVSFRTLTKSIEKFKEGYTQ